MKKEIENILNLIYKTEDFCMKNYSDTDLIAGVRQSTLVSIRFSLEGLIEELKQNELVEK